MWCAFCEGVSGGVWCAFCEGESGGVWCVRGYPSYTRRDGVNWWYQ